MAASSGSHLRSLTILLWAVVLISTLDLKTGASVVAEEQSDIATVIPSNSTISYPSRCNKGDGSYDCQIIAYVQPEVELDAEVVPRRSLIDSSTVTGGVNNNASAASCGRDKPPSGRYYPCTTDPASGTPDPQQCDAFNREKPCH